MIFPTLSAIISLSQYGERIPSQIVSPGNVVSGEQLVGQLLTSNERNRRQAIPLRE
jgi:hypothetical protein